MAYQEVTRTGYGSRLMNAIKGIGGGFMLFIGGTVLLWWNEGRAVKTAQMLEEAEGIAVHVEDVSSVNPTYEGKLIHATAFTQTSDSLVDPVFKVGATGIRLERQVEYYQWKEKSETETREKIGGTEEKITTYTYRQEWVSAPINSQNFKDPAYQGKNKASMDVRTEEFQAETVYFGAYRMCEELISSMTGDDPLELNIPKGLLVQLGNNQEMMQTGKITPDSVAGKTPYATVNGNVLYLGANVHSPQIGDMRITFSKVMPDEVSVIAAVYQDKLQPYLAKNGKTLTSLEMGAVSMQQMFQNEKDDNNMWKWIYRALGLALVFMGLRAIFAVFTILFKVLPFLADIVDLGMGMACGIVAFVWSLLIVAMAWLFYRPLIGIIFLVIAVGTIFYFVQRSRKQKRRQAIFEGEFVQPAQPQQPKLQ